MSTNCTKTFQGTLLILVGAFSVSTVNPAFAQPSTPGSTINIGPIALPQSSTSGSTINVFADPQDFVVELDQPGNCGSKYFVIPRSNVNFKEMVAVALTAFATSKPLTFFVASCNTDRNIISHGFVSK